MLGHICTKSIQADFGIFFDFILVSHSFHCSHIISIFSEIFPIFVAVLFISKACHFNTALFILLPFRHLHSCMLCRIKLYNTHHMCSLRHQFSHALGRIKVKAGYEIIGWDWVYAGSDTPTFLSSVIWPSLRSFLCQIIQISSSCCI